MPESGRASSNDNHGGDVQVTFADVLRAQLRPSRPLRHARRSGFWLKFESLQRAGSDKVRDTLNAIPAGAVCFGDFVASGWGPMGRTRTNSYDDMVIVRETELRENPVRLAMEEDFIAMGAVKADRPINGKRHCAVVSGSNTDAARLAQLLSQLRPKPPRKPRRRVINASEPFDEQPQFPPDATTPNKQMRRPTAVRTAEAVEESIA